MKAEPAGLTAADLVAMAPTARDRLIATLTEPEAEGVRFVWPFWVRLL